MSELSYQRQPAGGAPPVVNPPADPALDLPEDEQAPADTPYLTAADLTPRNNLAALLPEEFLEKLGQDAKRHIDIDESSRAEWLEVMRKSLDLAMQVAKTKSYPHDRASNVIYPMITKAAVQFAQRCYMAVVPSDRIVQCVVIGDDSGAFEVQTDPATGRPIPPKNKPDGTPDAPMAVEPGAKAARADRVSQHMSWQCLFSMPEWEPGIDQLLHYLPIAGVAVRRITYDASEKRPTVDWYPGDKFIINARAKSIKSAARFSVEHDFYPFQIKEKMLRGEWITTEVDSLRPDDDADQNDDQAPRVFYEHHCRLDLDGSGYEKPYIVTLHKEGRVVRIEINWKAVKADGTVDPILEYVKYSFIPNPKGGWYDVGFGWLLSQLNEAVNSTINQLFDAGHWQNAPTGLLGRGVRLGRAGDVTLKPNSLKTVDASGEELAKNIWIYQHPGPSPVLFQLLGLLIEAGNDISSVQDVMQGRTEQNMQPTTVMALVEQGMTTFTSIFKRVHRGLKEEFGILYDINRETLPSHMYQYGEILDNPRAIAADDYAAEDQDIRPVTDPKMVSDQVKMAKAGALGQMAEKGQVNQLEATKRQLEAMGISDVEALLPDPNAKNPMVELQVERLKLENRKLDQQIQNERIDRIMKADETRAKILKIRADAVKALADAEAAEEGQQLAYYQSLIDQLDSASSALEALAKEREAAAAQGEAPPAEMGAPGAAPALPAMAGAA